MPFNSIFNALKTGKNREVYPTLRRFLTASIQSKVLTEALLMYLLCFIYYENKSGYGFILVSGFLIKKKANL